MNQKEFSHVQTLHVSLTLIKFYMLSSILILTYEQRILVLLLDDGPEELKLVDSIFAVLIDHTIRHMQSRYLWRMETILTLRGLNHFHVARHSSLHQIKHGSSG
jgi:hypothetical protein